MPNIQLPGVPEGENRIIGEKNAIFKEITTGKFLEIMPNMYFHTK